MSGFQRVKAMARGFGMFWWDFIVGEDITIAIGVCLGLGAVAIFHAHRLSTWWALPVLWLLALFVSLAKVLRKAR